MATLREIKQRIKSIKSTQQITKAMKMVAAAKMRRAQERMFAARPYDQVGTGRDSPSSCTTDVALVASSRRARPGGEAGRGPPHPASWAWRTTRAESVF